MVAQSVAYLHWQYLTNHLEEPELLSFKSNMFKIQHTE